jgi:hypothetical protein
MIGAMIRGEFAEIASRVARRSALLMKRPVRAARWRRPVAGDWRAGWRSGVRHRNAGDDAGVDVHDRKVHQPKVSAGQAIKSRTSEAPGGGLAAESGFGEIEARCPAVRWCAKRWRNSEKVLRKSYFFFDRGEALGILGIAS